MTEGHAILPAGESGCGDEEPVPASAGVTPAPSGLISPPLSTRKADGMRRLGTGTGFAGAKLSEVLPRSERSLASVTMTEGAVASLGNLTSLPLPLWEGGTIAPLIWGSGCLRDYFSKICAAHIFGMGHWVQGSAPAAHRAGDQQTEESRATASPERNCQWHAAGSRGPSTPQTPVG